MLWIKMGWRNLWRNRRRSIIELTSIAGSIFLAIFMNNLAVGSYAQMINDGVKMGSGHIGLYRSNYLEIRKTEQTMPAAEFMEKIGKLPEVESVYARLNVPGLVRSSRDSRGGVLMGIDIDKEKNSNPILAPDRLESGEYPSPEDERGALIGAGLAEDLGLDVGNKFVVMTQGADGKIASSLLRISGIIRTNARIFDARMVIVPRHLLANIIGKPNSAHEISVILKNHEMVNKMLPVLSGIADSGDDVKAYFWEDAMPELANAVKMDHIGLQIMVAFMYLIVGIGTINTLLMSVMERTREFGVIRAIGLNKKHIRKIVFSEAFVLSVTGVVIGVALALLGGLYTSTHGIDYSGLMEDQSAAGTLIDPIMYSGWDWTTVIVLGIGMVLLALVASLYPAHHIMKIRPSDAMRKY